MKDEIFILHCGAGAKSCQSSSAEPGLLVGGVCACSVVVGVILPCPLSQWDGICGVPRAPAVVAAVLIPQPDQGMVPV